MEEVEAHTGIQLKQNQVISDHMEVAEVWAMVI